MRPITYSKNQTTGTIDLRAKQEAKAYRTKQIRRHIEELRRANPVSFSIRQQVSVLLKRKETV